MDISELTNLSAADIASLPLEDRKQLLGQMEQVVENEIAKERIRFFRPFPWQETFIEQSHKMMVVFAPSPNKIGKTVVAVVLGQSWGEGAELWNPLPHDHPEAVKREMSDGIKFFRRSGLGIEPPVDIVICGEDWKEHIGKTLIPEFKKWASGRWYCPRRNEQGLEAEWKHKSNRSTIGFMCYTQDKKLFESRKIQGVIEDEPPPQDKREAMKRGLYYDRGKELITATPLSEPWLLDELVLKIDPETYVMQGLTILDNPEKYKNEKDALIEMGMTDMNILRYFDLLIYEDPIKKSCVQDKGRKAEQFVMDLVDADKQHLMQRLDILRFVKATHPDKAPARFHGTFRALVGRIYKEFDRGRHIIPAPLDEDGALIIKPDWLIVPCIDWHPGTPIALSFYALTENGMIICVGETFRNMDPDGTADMIIKRFLQQWRMKTVIIDALARGDTGFIRNRQKDGAKPEDTFAIIEKRLKAHGLKLITGSRDRDSGITNVQTRLKGPNGIPTVYFFDHLPGCQGDYGHVYEFDRWTRDEDGKPKEEYNHFLVNLGWVTLSGIRWTKPKPPPTPDIYGGGFPGDGGGTWQRG